MSLANLTLQELQAQVDLGLVVQPDSEDDEVRGVDTWMVVKSCNLLQRVEDAYHPLFPRLQQIDILLR